MATLGWALGVVLVGIGAVYVFLVLLSGAIQPPDRSPFD